MTNEEQILQELRTFRQEFGSFKQNAEQRFEKYDKDFEQVKESNTQLVESNARLIESNARLEATTDNIATTVMNIWSDVENLKEGQKRMVVVEQNTEKILKCEDKIVGKYEMLDQERQAMTVDIENHEERIVVLETTLNIKTTV